MQLLSILKAKAERNTGKMSKMAGQIGNDLGSKGEAWSVAWGLLQ